MSPSFSTSTELTSSALGSRFAAFEGQFSLPNYMPARRAVSAELTAFREQLHELSNLSTLGLVTLSGVSLRNEGLEKLAESIADMSSAEDQVSAIEDLLQESDKLPHDQNAHVIAKVIQDLLLKGRSGLDPHARPSIGRRIFRAGLKVGPNLLPESLEADSLGLWLNRLVDCDAFEFPRGSHETLADAGLADPSQESVRIRRRNVAKRIDEELNRMVRGRMHPDDLQLLLARISPHPDELRSRLLTMVINMSGHTLRRQDTAEFNRDILHMVDSLPLQYRVTPMEAYCNQINVLPNHLARVLMRDVRRSIERLTDTHDFRLNRTRREILERLHYQRDLLDNASFLPSESITDLERRIAAR